MKLVTTLALAPKRFGCFFRQEEIELDFHPMRIENISIGQDLVHFATSFVLSMCYSK